MTLRSGKAVGLDEIQAEAIKADTDIAVNMLYSLFSKIWEKEIPAKREEGIIIKLPKKKKKKKKEKKTLETAANIEGSCYCQRQARLSTGFYWTG